MSGANDNYDSIAFRKSSRPLTQIALANEPKIHEPVTGDKSATLDDLTRWRPGVTNFQNERLIANANPSKSFFIAMLTRDIDIIDCILDLLDNSVDGISALSRRNGGGSSNQMRFQDHAVSIEFNREQFVITDRSGGIPIDVAENYAFRFGRPDDAPPVNSEAIGIYGIGMKRAMFKIGNRISLTSSTGDESFSLELNVDEWRRQPQVSENERGGESVEWSFPLSNVVRTGTQVPMGTTIQITGLNEQISRQFGSPGFFDRVVRQVSMDYAYILTRGLQVTVNSYEVKGILPLLRDGGEFVPFRHVDEYDGVRTEITVGLADPPPDDTTANSRSADSSAYGWYVVCNDRVVVSADKSAITGWGIRPVPTWHPQYGGFLGVVRFESSDPRKLPWKTTKRDVETTNAAFQRALALMMRATKKLTDYTNQRRAEAKRLKRLERAAPQVAVSRVTENTQMRLPVVSARDLVSIEYVRESADVEAVARSLGLITISPAEVGIRTFEYYLQREVSQ